MNKGRIITALATILAIPAMAAPAGYFQVPGTETTLKIYGKAETWAYYNMDQPGNVSTTGKDQSWSQTGTTDSWTVGRFGFQTSTPSAYGDVNVKVEFEGKTVGGGTNSWGNPFRLRHAYGEFGGLLIGQTNSLWVDWQYCPSYNDTFNSDFNGATYRTRQLRYTFEPTKGVKVAFSAEQDNSGGGTTKLGTSLYGAVKYSADWGYIVGVVGYQKKEDWSGYGNVVPADDNKTTSGTSISFNLGGAYNITDKDEIGLRIINGGGHTGNGVYGVKDGFVAKDDAYKFYKSTSIDLGYSHTWNDQFTTSLGINNISFPKDVDLGHNYKVTVSEFFINTNWHVTKTATFGLEYFDSTAKVSDNEGGNNNIITKKDGTGTDKVHTNGVNLFFSYQFF